MVKIEVELTLYLVIFRQLLAVMLVFCFGG